MALTRLLLLSNCSSLILWLGANSIITGAVAFLVAPQIVRSGFCEIERAYTTNALRDSSITDTIQDKAVCVDVDEIPMEKRLSYLLDNGTRKSHSMAENTAFVTGFFKGLSTRDSYQQLITSLYYVYDAMESAMDDDALMAAHPGIQMLDKPGMRRIPALHDDLQYFYDKDTFDVGMIEAPSPATQVYVKRIQELSSNVDDTAYLLIAHQYSRYLGDLFGGQMMSNMAQSSLKLNDNNGIAFYRFTDIVPPDVKPFIDVWYATLNALNYTPQQKAAIVDEANYVFALNIAIFEELDGSAFKSAWAIFWSTMKEKFGSSSSTATL